jgi:hypothetical protein
MRSPILSAGLIVGAMAFGQAGCHQADKAKTAYQPKKPDDPTAWTDKDVTKGSSDSGSDPSALPKSSGVKGTWSSEGQDIERSLGIGK